MSRPARQSHRLCRQRDRAAARRNIDATGDIVAADVGAPASTPTTLARGARAHFFVTPSRDRVVFTTDAGASPGLFVARLAL
jgi:hypothetical protein